MNPTMVGSQYADLDSALACMLGPERMVSEIRKPDAWLSDWGLLSVLKESQPGHHTWLSR